MDYSCFYLFILMEKYYEGMGKGIMNWKGEIRGIFVIYGFVGN